jgi:ferritin-like metal-binding protein YciE
VSCSCTSWQPSEEITDLLLTGAAARAEHYEITAYEGLIGMAKALGEAKSATVLEKNLKQETAALQKMTSVGKRLIAGSGREKAAA